MICTEIEIAGGKAVICQSGIKRPAPCYRCSRPSVALCDFPQRNAHKGKTCDAPMCEEHRNKGASPNVDFCAYHFPIAKAAHDRRQAGLDIASPETAVLAT